MVIIIALTCGIASSDTSKIEVTSANNGYSVFILEEWYGEMTDIDLFYKNVDKREDKMDNDICIHMFAMIKAERDKQRDLNWHSLWTAFHTTLPFQANPATLNQEIIGNEEGSQFLHIDITKKERTKISKLKMMTRGKDEP